MAHSHLAVRHLIRQVESRGRRDLRPAPPEWIKEFVSDLADCFEPTVGIARVGYRCCQRNNLWTAAVFLAARECVGGPDDGECAITGFRFDISALLQRFQQVEVCCWNSAASAVAHVLADDFESADPSFLTIEGSIDITGAQRLRLQILSAPPAGASRSLHQTDEPRKMAAN